MRMPSKIYAFEESTLALFVLILTALSERPLQVTALADKFKADEAVNDLADALTALYALGKISLDETQGVISLVDKNLV